MINPPSLSSYSKDLFPNSHINHITLVPVLFQLHHSLQLKSELAPFSHGDSIEIPEYLSSASTSFPFKAGSQHFLLQLYDHFASLFLLPPWSALFNLMPHDVRELHIYEILVCNCGWFPSFPSQHAARFPKRRSKFCSGEKGSIYGTAQCRECVRVHRKSLCAGWPCHHSFLHFQNLLSHRNSA